MIDSAVASQPLPMWYVASERTISGGGPPHAGGGGEGARRGLDAGRQHPLDHVEGLVVRQPQVLAHRHGLRGRRR
jgi:hypothetical protein